MTDEIKFFLGLTVIPLIGWIVSVERRISTLASLEKKVDKVDEKVDSVDGKLDRIMEHMVLEQHRKPIDQLFQKVI